MVRLRPALLGVWIAAAAGLVPAWSGSGGTTDSPSGRSPGTPPASDRVLPYEQHALTHDGDPARGKTLFFDEARTRCVVCHKVADRGGEVGPDLSAIGGKFARPHLIESLLEPSRQILEGFRTTVIATADGRVLTGIIKEQSAERLTIVDGNGRRQTVLTRDIAERKQEPVSLMPTGLADALSPAQLTDLVAYLESLRSSGQAPPGSRVSGGIRLPEGFEVATVVSGLTACTALETLADGRILVCEQTGALRVVKQGKLLDAPALTVPVNSYWERGLIGVTVDPHDPESPYVYVCYIAREPFPHHRVSRFTLRGDVAEAGSETILLHGDDQTRLGGRVPAGHQGGALHFGADGSLYIAIGDQTAGSPSQRLDTFQGKILRIRADGSIPDDNPLAGRTTGKYRAIWALGLRNPYTFAISRARGIMLINDVGEKFEEINRGVPGGNYGWPLADGPGQDPRFLDPLHVYPHASVCGGDFVPEDSRWPQRYLGKYVFADFIHGWIKTLDPDHPDRVETFLGGVRNPVDLRFARDGSLYVLLRNAWVLDGKFQARTGTLLRIRSTTAPGQSGPSR